MENVFSEKLLHPSGPNCLKDKNEPQQLRTTLHEFRHRTSGAAPGPPRGLPPGLPPGAAQPGGAPSSMRSTPPTMRATPAAVTQVNGSRNSSRPASAVSATPAADQMP